MTHPSITPPRLHAVILAAGKGTRMRSDLAKVLHVAAGRPLLSWVMAAVASIEPDTVTVVVGHQAEEVAATLPDGVATVLQDPQNGTGHATRLAVDAVGPAAGDIVVVLPGDMPLVSAATLARLRGAHDGVDAVVVTARVADPHGYGRVVRDETDPTRVRAIVEELDATDAQRAIDEVNTSIYSFTAGPLMGALSDLRSHNAQGEQYLTDVVGLLTASGRAVGAVEAPEHEGMGVNTVEQLAAVSARLERSGSPGDAHRLR